ncbi:hypothetical protein RJ641_010401 [Dillenia turbinata]|uniref:WAT1-related protein n=1 Tax=Dillenia turbinata TaxID=194707 RepID=A0AAN8V622_9MAGN
MNAKKPHLAVILIQVLYSGMLLLSKAAFNGGINSFVFVFYRQTFSCFLLVPLALTLEWYYLSPYSFLFGRRGHHSHLQPSARSLCSLFNSELITLSLETCGVGLVYTSATLASATSNCLPAITFFLAFLHRIKQDGVMKAYTSKLLFTSLQCVLSSIQSSAIALALERDMNRWKLGSDVRLLAIAYCVTNQ